MRFSLFTLSGFVIASSNDEKLVIKTAGSPITIANALSAVRLSADSPLKEVESGTSKIESEKVLSSPLVDNYGVDFYIPTVGQDDSKYSYVRTDCGYVHCSARKVDASDFNGLDRYEAPSFGSVISVIDSSIDRDDVGSYIQDAVSTNTKSRVVPDFNGLDRYEAPVIRSVIPAVASSIVGDDIGSYIYEATKANTKSRAVVADFNGLDRYEAPSVRPIVPVIASSMVGEGCGYFHDATTECKTRKPSTEVDFNGLDRYEAPVAKSVSVRIAGFNREGCGNCCL